MAFFNHNDNQFYDRIAASVIKRDMTKMHSFDLANILWSLAVADQLHSSVSLKACEAITSDPEKYLATRDMNQLYQSDLTARQSSNAAIVVLPLYVNILHCLICPIYDVSLKVVNMFSYNDIYVYICIYRHMRQIALGRLMEDVYIPSGCEIQIQKTLDALQRPFSTQVTTSIGYRYSLSFSLFRPFKAFSYRVVFSYKPSLALVPSHAVSILLSTIRC